MAGEGLTEEVRSELGLENGFNWVKCRGSGKTIPGSGTSTCVALTTGWVGPPCGGRRTRGSGGYTYAFRSQTESL